jgi:hypothetical protein
LKLTPSNSASPAISFLRREAIRTAMWVWLQ